MLFLQDFFLLEVRLSHFYKAQRCALPLKSFSWPKIEFENLLSRLTLGWNGRLSDFLTYGPMFTMPDNKNNI